MKVSAARARMSADVKRGVDTPDWIVRIGEDWGGEVEEWCDGKD